MQKSKLFLLSQKLKELRIDRHGDKHGSQKKFADELGIPYTTYRTYEEIEHKKIGIDLLQGLLKINVSIEHLLTGESPQTCTVCMNEEEKEWCRRLINAFRENENSIEGLKMHIDSALKNILKKNVSSYSSKGARKNWSKE